MTRKTTFKSVVAAGAIATAANFAAGDVDALPLTIAAQSNNGDVYEIDVSSGTATLLRDLKDFNDPSGDPQFSPNALGFDGGDFFRSTFGNKTPTSNSINNPDLIKNDEVIVNGLPVAGSQAQIAAGDATNGTYYYADRSGNIRTVSGLSSTTPKADPGFLFNVGGDTLGDLVVRGDDLIISIGSTLQLWDLSDTDPNKDAVASLDYGTVNFSSEPNSGRFAGLAFAGNQLYGFDVDGNKNNLFSIDTSTSGSTFGSVARIGEINRNGAGMFTDAATIPLPAAAWMLLAASGGLIAAKRRQARKAA